MEHNTETKPAPSSATTETQEPITLDESKRLIELEKIIDVGKQPFVAVGNALAEIRDSRLYRSDCKSFEAYCQEKWGFSKQHAYRMIKAAPIAASNLQVTTLNQANELAKVPAPKRAAVIKAATTMAESAGRPMTALNIQMAAQPAVEVATVPTVLADPARPALDFEPAFELLNSIKQSAIRKDLPAYKSLLALETCLRQLASTAADLTKNTSSNN